MTQTTETFVVLLRGVNVGKARRVAMADWRTLLANLGGLDVQTLLNSGNAIFRANPVAPDRLAGVIADAMDSRMSVQVPVLVKTAADIHRTVDDNPFASSVPDPSRLLVAFTQAPDDLDALRAIEPLVAADERFAIGPHAAYLHCPRGILKSRAGEGLVGGKVGSLVTTRNWATTLKLHARLPDVGPKEMQRRYDAMLGRET